MGKLSTKETSLVTTLSHSNDIPWGQWKTSKHSEALHTACEWLRRFFSSSDKLPSGNGNLLRAALQLDSQEDIELGLHHCCLFPSKGICCGQWAGAVQAAGRTAVPVQQGSQPSQDPQPRSPPWVSVSHLTSRASPQYCL